MGNKARKTGQSRPSLCSESRLYSRPRATTMKGHAQTAKERIGMERIADRMKMLQWCVLFALCLTPANDREVRAQVQILPGVQQQRGGPSAVKNRGRLFVTDRDMSQRLIAARQLLQRGQTSQALTLLQSILDRSEDYAFVTENEVPGEFQGSLKSQAIATLDGLTDDERRIYVLQYETPARQLLERASASDDVAILEEVTRRFYHTDAGAEAAYRLGSYYLDHSDSRAAAMVFESLRRSRTGSARWEPMLSLKTAVCWRLAADTQRCVATLADLKQSISENFITLGGKRVAFFDSDDDALQWLAMLVDELPEFSATEREGWSMFAGNPQRNPHNSGAAPTLVTAWSYPTVLLSTYYDPQDVQEFERQLLSLQTSYRGSSFLTQPAAHPLLLDGVIVFRTLSNVRALNSNDGSLLWESAVLSPRFETLREERLGNAGPIAATGDSSLKSFLTQRSWRDLTVGTLSSDSEHVFVVENLAAPVEPTFVARGMPVVATPTTNMLTALELSSGKLTWEIGGPRGDYELQQSGTFFLGPPLPHEGSLYCLTESSGEIRLLVLDPNTGGLVWSQPIVQPATGLTQYTPRRQAGLAPSTADGVMICPTAAGAVVAVDLVRRMLLWGYVYDRNVPPVPQDRRGALLAQVADYFLKSGKNDEDRWTDSPITISAGRAIVTPRDSDELHCLELSDGSLHWKRSRGEGLYVAAVYDGKVLVVGKNEVRALSLSDGSDVWSAPTPIPTPAGRGFRSGSLYRLPLSTGELASVDIGTGRIQARTTVAVPGGIGNLVAADGRVLSQTPHEIVGYQSLDQLQQRIQNDLANDPQDATALVRQGELLLHQGDEQAGLETLRKGLNSDAASRCRETLVATLLEGLRVDFSKYREAGEELDRLTEGSRQRARYLQLSADGLNRGGDRLAAFAKYLQFVESAFADSDVGEAEGSLRVRSDYWTRPRLAELYRLSTAAERAVIDEECRKRAESIAAEGGEAALKNLSIALAELPIGGELLRQEVESSTASSLETQFALHRLRSIDNGAHAAFATAREARLLIEAGRADEAGPLLNALSSKWSDVACLDGQTGKELVELWRTDPDVAELTSRNTWPAGSFEAEKSIARNTVGNLQKVDLIGPTGFFGDGWTLVLDTARRALVLRDGRGSIKWKMQLNQPDPSYQYLPNRYAIVRGHLLTVVLGGKFYVFDLLGENELEPLWSKMLYEVPPDQPMDPRRGRWLGGRGNMSSLKQDPFGRPLGRIGPITDEFLCYQVGTSLFAADPLTGDVLWERRNLSRGSECFGDREYVFVVPPATRNAVVLRALDGRDIGRRLLPPERSRLFSLGRNLLTWNSTEGALALIDLFSDQVVWERDFGAGAQATMIEDDEVAVLEPGGRLTVLMAATGTERVQAAVDAINELHHFVVLRSPSRYVLMTHGAPEDPLGGRLTIPNFNLTEVNGNAYGFDRETGARIWKTAIGQQAFNPSQPSELPVLTLAAQTYSPGLVRDQRPFSLLLLDKRTGEVIFKDESPNRTPRFQVVVDPEQSNIELVFDTFKITLKSRKPSDDAEPPT